MVQGCNLNCTHCFTLGNRDPYKLLDHTVARKFLGSIKKNVNPRYATMYIHGGETFLAPLAHLSDINKIIHEEMGDTKLNIIPQTNLMYEIDEEFINFIHKEYKGQLGVSWDHGIRFNSGSRALNEDLFFKNFKRLVDNKIEMAVAITVQKHLLKADIENILPMFNGATSLDFEFLTIFDEKTNSLKVSNDEWATFYQRIVKYYSSNETSWSLPQADLFTRSYIENKIYNCKCNCCQHRTFTLNCNGTLGLCPDETYVRPLSDIEEMSERWPDFERKAREQHFTHITQEMNPLCQNCDLFDVCGGNCEPSLFDDKSSECPLSKSVLNYQKENIGLFKAKLEKAKINLIELRT